MPEESTDCCTKVRQSDGASIPLESARQILADVNHGTSPLSAGTLVEALDRAAAGTPGVMTVFSSTAQSLTIAELVAASTRAADGFRRQGLRPGALVGLLMPPEPDLLVSLVGLFKAGATVGMLPTPVAFGDSAGEMTRLSRIVKASRMRYIAADARFDVVAAGLLDIHHDLQILRVNTTRSGSAETPDPQDPAVVQLPAGVVLNHDAVMAGIRASGRWPATDVFDRWCPLNHEVEVFWSLSQLLHENASAGRVESEVVG